MAVTPSIPATPAGDKPADPTTERAVHKTTAHTSRTGAHHSRSSHVLHRLGDWSAKPEAGVTVTILLLVWAIVGIATGFPTWWQVALYSTCSAVTVVMVFAIQHTQRREQLVTQRKLDELVRAQPQADNRMIRVEAATDHELDDLMDVEGG